MHKSQIMWVKHHTTFLFLNISFSILSQDNYTPQKCATLSVCTGNVENKEIYHVFEDSSKLFAKWNEPTYHESRGDLGSHNSEAGHVETDVLVKDLAWRHDL